MQGLNIHTEQGNYVICLPGSGTISSEKDVNDLLSFVFEIKSSGLVIFETELDPDFFDLKTGLLERIFLQLSTSQIKTAFIVDDRKIVDKSFLELMKNQEKSAEIRFFKTLTNAEKWLFTPR